MTEPPYSAIEQKLQKDPHLLLGNGFSIAYDKLFGYASLFDYAKEGMSPDVLRVFGHLGTNNFEGVMRLLSDGDWLTKLYKYAPTKGSGDMLADLESLKASLVKAIADTHPDTTHEVRSSKKACCAKFLERYHNIFTTNYDLLLYWVEMGSLQTLRGRDGFGDVEGDEAEDYVVFCNHVGGDKGIFFLHGALHLYVADGEVRKHCWNRNNRTLIDNVRDGLKQNQFPLFVAEGEANKKLEQIEGSSYLSYCLSKLGRIEKDVVTLGLSFGDSDEHICNVLARNRKLKRMFVGLYGSFTSSWNLEVQRNIAKIQEHRNLLMAKRPKLYKLPLDVEFYRSDSVSLWNDNSQAT